MKKNRIKEPTPVVIPYSAQAEKAVLGAIFIEPNFVDYAVESLKPDDFYDPKNQAIFNGILELVRKRQAVDAVSVAEAAKKFEPEKNFQPEEYLQELIEAVPLIGYPLAHIKLLKDLSLKRELIKLAADVSNKALAPDTEVDELLSFCDQKFSKIMNQKDFHPYADLATTLSDTIDLIGRSLTNQTGVHNMLWFCTKFKDLNKLIGGLSRGDLIIIAARPGMGKTAFVLNLACDLCFRQDVPVGFFSLEMSKEQIGIRILSLRTGIDSNAIKTGTLSKDDYADLAEEAEKLASKPFFIDDTAGITLTDLRVKARRLVREQKIGVIFIDYLQLIRNLSSHIHTREQEISEISRSLKALAKDLNIPVVAVSQLNRAVEGRENKRPVLSDLRESGAIEQDADIIMFLFREDFYKNNQQEDSSSVAEIIVAKHRNGPTGTVKLAFLKETMMFENYLAEPAIPHSFA
ncbi:MAG: replicative DNA helicase [Deltaproteobacteria bacterium]|nr:replicative DNA helicase [Deltaproteobacteria bacterium]